MAFLSTRHDGKVAGVLDSKAILEAVHANECALKNRQLVTISPSLSECTSLRKLDVSYNLFESVENIEQLKNLRELLCYSNRLGDVGRLGDLKQLEVLLLQQNCLTCLPLSFSSMVRLTELRLDHNRIEFLGSAMVGCSSLRRLDLSYNRLHSVSGLSGLQNLDELRLSGNAIKSLRGLKSLPSLVDLDCSNNLLQNLDGLECILTLEALKVNHNRLTSISLKQPHLKKLKEVRASSNKLSSFTGIETLGGSSVEILDVSGNYIAFQDLMEGKGGLNALAKFPSLKEINLGRNPGFDHEDESESNADVFGALRSKLRHILPQLHAINGYAFANEEDILKSWHPTEFQKLQTNPYHSIGDDDDNHDSKSHPIENVSDDMDSVHDKCSDGYQSKDGYSRTGQGQDALSARVVKEIVSMEELESMESSIRKVFDSTKEILESVFLLDDTPDGLFSSVPASELPNNSQLQKIAVPSIRHTRSNASPEVETLENTIETEETGLESQVATKGSIIIQNIDALSPSVESTSLSSRGIIFATTDSPTVNDLPQEQQTNKEYVDALVNEIKVKVAREGVLSPNKTSGGTVGVLPSRHDRDLPRGSGLTRYGSRIHGLGSVHSVVSVSAESLTTPFEERDWTRVEGGEEVQVQAGMKDDDAQVRRESSEIGNKMRFDGPGGVPRLPESIRAFDTRFVSSRQSVQSSELSEEGDDTDVHSDGGMPSPSLVSISKHSRQFWRRLSDSSVNSTQDRSPEKVLDTRSFRPPLFSHTQKNIDSNLERKILDL